MKEEMLLLDSDLPMPDLLTPEGLLVGTAVLIVMYHLLRDALSSPTGSRLSPALLLALGLPAWPIPMLVLTFLALQPHLPGFFPSLPEECLIETEPLEELFLSGARDWWTILKGLRVLACLTAWAGLHLLFSEAVRKQIRGK